LALPTAARRHEFLAVDERRQRALLALMAWRVNVMGV